MLKKTDNRGFTFIELILYMAILAVFMVAVTSLVGSTVASNRKISSRKKLQTQATETYDTIAEMLMAASDVRIHGAAYIGTTSSGVLSYSKVEHSNFLIPGSDGTEDNKDASGQLVKNGGVAVRTQRLVKSGYYVTMYPCYDIADIKPFLDTASPSTDEQTYIDIEHLFIKYASGIDSSTGDNIYTYCTLSYDKTKKNIYIYRISSDEAGFNSTQHTQYMYDYSDKDGNILCKNVESFKLQVNAETGTIAILLDFKDSKANVTYDLGGVVSLRNSYVLKKHEW